MDINVVTSADDRRRRTEALLLALGFSVQGETEIDG